MLLDLRTVYVVGAATTLILGAIQLVAFATGRFERWPLWWGLSNLGVGAGILAASFRGFIPGFVSIELANLVMWTGFLMLHAAVRSFAGRPLPVAVYGASIVLAGTLLFLWHEPVHFSRRVVLMALLTAACEGAILREAWRLARQDQLASAWILVGLFVPSFLFSLIRAGLALADRLGGELFPASGASGQWAHVVGVAFMIMRSSTLLLLATERSRNQLLLLAQQDALTGIMNRTGFERAMAGLTGPLSGKRRHRGCLSLIVVDIDHFKALNDTHGHMAGDEVLRLFAQSARRQLRATDVLARQGGDEFAIVLPGASSTEANRVAERIRQAFAEEMTARGFETRPTLSIGIAEAETGGDLDALLRAADEALYRSKRLGRDRIQTQGELLPA